MGTSCENHVVWRKITSFIDFCRRASNADVDPYPNPIPNPKPNPNTNPYPNHYSNPNKIILKIMFKYINIDK